MSTGPSKEELENYWQNSRQYFDELAKYYQQADPAYYKKYILPYYNNPFKVSGSTSGGKAGFIIIAVVIMLISLLSAVVFLLLSSSQDEETNITEDRAVTYETSQTDSTALREVVTDAPDTSIHFKRGSDFFRMKKYKLAERFLKNVPESDPQYDEARRMLKIIEEKSKTENNSKRKIIDSKITDREKEVVPENKTETERPRTIRPQAKERIR